MTPDLTRRHVAASIAAAVAGTIGGALLGKLDLGKATFVPTDAVGDAAIVASTLPTGSNATVAPGATDNSPIFNSDTAPLKAGALYRFGPGIYAFSTPLTQPYGVSGAGAGHAHHAYVIGGIRRTGTILAIKGQAGASSYKLQGNTYGSVSLRDVSIYDTSGAEIDCVLDLNRSMHVDVQNVEVACLGAAKGYGIKAWSTQSPNANTLYGILYHLKVTNVRVGLGIFDCVNGLAVVGGSIQGTRYALEVGASYYQPTSNCCIGVSFEIAGLTADSDIRFMPDGAGVHGYPNTGNVYVVVLNKIGPCRGFDFRGCYYEIGNLPATFNDGTNGTWPLVPVVSAEAGAQNVDFGTLPFIYLLDAGRGTKAILPNGEVYDTSRRAGLHLVKGSDQAIPAGAYMPIAFDGSAVRRDDTRIAYGADGTITFKEDGDYLVCWTAHFGNITGSAVPQIRARLSLPGLRNYEGFYAPNVAVGSPATVGASVIVFGVKAGQAMQAMVFQNSDGAQTIQGDATQTYLTVTKQ